MHLSVAEGYIIASPLLLDIFRFILKISMESVMISLRSKNLVKHVLFTMGLRAWPHVPSLQSAVRDAFLPCLWTRNPCVSVENSLRLTVCTPSCAP